jgi:hypothetical protein
MNEKEELQEQLSEAIETIDNMVGAIGDAIIGIAYDNTDFICTRCLKTAEELYDLMKLYARGKDCKSIREQYQYITGRDLDE